MQEQGYWAKYRGEKVEKAVFAAKKLFSANKIENVKMTDIAKECDIGVALPLFFDERSHCDRGRKTLVAADKRIFEAAV